MRLSHTDLGPVLAIMAGGALGLFGSAAVALSSSADVSSSPAYFLDEDGSLQLRNGVTGTWVLGVDLGREGSGNAKFVLEQEGEAITGRYTGAMGDRIEVSGTVKDGKVVLAFDSSRGVIHYEGTLEGTTMKGTCVYALRRGMAADAS
jgi:hypothetical protein